jgi:SAM-dependent methyltransferase
MQTKRATQHLPYEVDEAANRHHFYENHWKRVGDVAGWTLLDYGCGRGETMRYASELKMSPRGLDSDPECVRLSSAFGPAEILDLTNPAVQLPPRSFDVVACLHVLEHVDNPKQVLTMLAQAARRYVPVAVPNLQKIPNLRKPHAVPEKCNEGHLQSWDHAHFRNLAENHCGLQVVEWSNDATIVPVASELIRRVCGNRILIHWETGLFGRLFPFWGISIIALLKPVTESP